MNSRYMLLLSTITWLALYTTSHAQAIRLNQIQVIGTHNSYHIAPEPEVLRYLERIRPTTAKEVDYSHRPLREQFQKLGIRQIELDLFADPNGGLFAKPSTLRLLEKEQEFDPKRLMQQPGYKVLHRQDTDYRSRVPTLKMALEEVLRWSKRHPRHVPITTLLELKGGSSPGLTEPRKISRDELVALEREILTVVSRDRVLTPDDVRGSFSSLREAIIERGWPRLDDVRGRIMFCLDNTGPIRSEYLALHAKLHDALLFASVDEDHPAAAWFKINDPVADYDRIRRLARAGFLIRTRADAGTWQSRQNDTRRRDRAFATGAHYISTDYPEPDLRFSTYQVRFPAGVMVRANPVTGQGLPESDLEQFSSR